jgi:hypothetical protein
VLSYRAEPVGNQKDVPSPMQRIPQAAQSACIIAYTTLRKSHCYKLKTILSIRLHFANDTLTFDRNQNSGIAMNSFPWLCHFHEYQNVPRHEFSKQSVILKKNIFLKNFRMILAEI